MDMNTTRTLPDRSTGGYRHEALLYSGMTEFLDATLPFIRLAVSAGRPILVAVSAAKINLLRLRLGADAERVGFADMASIGRNPARIIEVWRAFVSAHSGAGQLFGIGEPVYPERTPDELAECQLHEELLNVAFDAGTPFWLLCPYDLEALADGVIEAAQRSHPFLEADGERHTSDLYTPIDPGGPFNRPPSPRPAGAEVLPFGLDGLRAVRDLVAARAAAAGLDAMTVTDTVLAVNEIATNSLRHGGGQGELAAWTDGRRLVFEVSDRGHITEPLVGRLAPALDASAGVGLWLANQTCDLVQIFSSARGTTVRLCQDF
jgi:anti-sigma regulatory factor (Ser/Thr protein kinase)